MLALLQVLLPIATQEPRTYSGRQHQLAVQVPRLDATVAIDGVLDEPVWSQAARLTDFSEYVPVDGVAAADSTVVLVWSSRRAIYFGIRAYEAHGAPHATVSDRDRITADDFVQILLDTSHDHRKAYVFGVNPLGIQADGILSEGIQSHETGIGAPATSRDTVDFSTDYTFESRGRVTPTGYEIEIRIPFSSIRFASGHDQSWGINVVREVQHSGYEDSWAPARQSNSSFLAQFGTLQGLGDISRGLVLDLNPEFTVHANGEPQPTGWKYGIPAPTLGGNLRWGVTDNLTADATIRPDFSQIEADVPQLVYDPRNALYFQEKRPFFLDGLEQFDTPNNLVYTRQIVQPDGATKLTGEIAGTNVGLLSAIDAGSVSTNGRDNPVFNILRVTRGLGPVAVGGIITDREDGPYYNHVGGLDARWQFADIYSLRLQGVESSTHADTAGGAGPLWDAMFERNGHNLRLHYQVTGISPNFYDESGYISRNGITNTVFDNALTLFGRPGGVFESYTFDFTQNSTWIYDTFLHLHRAEDVRWHFSNAVTLRGGWVFVGDLYLETYGYDPSLYANYYLAEKTPTGVDTVHFTGNANLPNLDIVTGFTTPRWKQFDASVQTITGYDDNFYEWSSAYIFFVNATIDWRPNERARLSLIYSQQQYVRRSNWTQVAVTRVPYIELAYQLSRPIYVRFIGEYSAATQSALRDDGRTNLPILIRDPATNTYSVAGASTTNTVSGDFLFSYQPTPGTVVFAGYNSNLTEPASFDFLHGLHRTSDGFFIKLSYLFHVGR